MTKLLPTVSILMTAYNRQEYIGEAIESVLNSSYPVFELIIADDQSKDETVKIANSYAAKDGRIKVHINKKNLGDYPNRNNVARMAAGEFIMYVDSDDKLNADTIQRLLEIIRTMPNFNFAMYWRHSDEIFTLESEAAIRLHFFEKQFLFMGPGATFIRRSFFEKIQGYPEKYGPANDMYFNLKACCYSTILLVPFEFIYYRRHDGQEVNNRFSYMYNNYRYMRDALDELPLGLNENELRWLKKKNKRRFTVHLFNYLRRTGNLKKTIEAYNKAEFSVTYILQGIFQKRNDVLS